MSLLFRSSTIKSSFYYCLLQIQQNLPTVFCGDHLRRLHSRPSSQQRDKLRGHAYVEPSKRKRQKCESLKVETQRRGCARRLLLLHQRKIRHLNTEARTSKKAPNDNETHAECDTLAKEILKKRRSVVPMKILFLVLSRACLRLHTHSCSLFYGV